MLIFCCCKNTWNHVLERKEEKDLGPTFFLRMGLGLWTAKLGGNIFLISFLTPLRISVLDTLTFFLPLFSLKGFSFNKNCGYWGLWKVFFVLRLSVHIQFLVEIVGHGQTRTLHIVSKGFYPFRRFSEAHAYAQWTVYNLWILMQQIWKYEDSHEEPHWGEAIQV